MRHPTDSMAWKHFDEIHKEFSLEPCNVRLGLASDGFQPFNQSKTSYIIWQVILIPYNLPPWVCMKDSNFILSMLIPGPEGLGDAIDIYLKPLIEELRELWEVGVDTFDASTRQNFNLHASLLWTINDFPTYGNLSGWSTKASNLTAVGRKPPDGHFAASHHLLAGRILASPCERDKRSPQGPCSPCEANERLANWDSGKLPKMMKKGE
nr:uncharacterized protein LOC109184453 [Ipomoea batatas]